jgi:CshA-type fibril repeat protein
VAPVAQDDNVTVDEDTVLHGDVIAGTSDGTVDGNATDSDADGDELNVTKFMVDINNDGTLEEFTPGQSATINDVGTITMDSNGSYTFTPDANYNGDVPKITYTINDGTDEAEADLNIKVNDVNDAPTANDDSASTDEDTAVEIDVPANDTDSDGTIDKTTVTIKTQPNHGTVSIDSTTGKVTYTPEADYNGPDSFTYTVKDEDGTESNEATVNITVKDVNDAPVATAIPAQTNEDIDTPSVDVSGNFSDIDGDTLSFSATGLPKGLSIDNTTGEITGTIDKTASQGGTNGVYSVTVTADDGNGGTTGETFDWTVTNPAPTAVNDVDSTLEEVAVTIDVLANDSDTDDNITLVSVDMPNNGTAVIVDGKVVYTPNVDFRGTDTFTYTIEDADSETATATVL